MNSNMFSSNCVYFCTYLELICFVYVFNNFYANRIGWFLRSLVKTTASFSLSLVVLFMALYDNDYFSCFLLTLEN